MAITVSQNPGEINQAYGVNAVSLSGITGEDKYVLRIKNQAGDIVADVRQTPNRYGQAIFDIQNILQTYIKPGDADIDSIGVNSTDPYRNSFNLGFLYDIEYGTETGGIFTSAGVLENFEVYPGRKEYWQERWPLNIYRSYINMSGVPEIYPRVVQEGLGLTDNKTIVKFSEPGLFLPYELYDNVVRADDQVTISYLQQVRTDEATPAATLSLGAMVVKTYDASGTQLNTYRIDNILSNGGGPNPNFGGTTLPTYPYSYITFGAGPANLESEVDFTGVSFYTVQPFNFALIYDNDLIPSQGWKGHKFTIDNGICLDFEPIQFSWMNSFGVRDYYTFTKKNERSVRIKRDTYLKSAADYNGTTYQVNPEDRGTTTYSQQLDQEYRANTDYISDLDAEWLESLFVSPDVRVRFSGQKQWYPVTLTSSSYTQKTFRKDRLFQYEVRFKLAHGIKSQRG